MKCASAWPRSKGWLPVLCLLAGLLTPRAGDCQQVVLEGVKLVTMAAASGLNAGKATAQGEIVAISIQDRRLYWLTDGTAARAMNIDGMPEARLAIRPPDLLPDVCPGPLGHVFVPAVWHQPGNGGGRRFFSGAFAFFPGSGYSHTVVFDPSVEVRWLAVGSTGDIYAAGLDAAYFRGISRECKMVHKFTEEGRRSAAFSDCPPKITEGFRSDLRAQYSRLKQDADHAHIWFRDDRVVHVLPASRLLRTFRTSGELISEIALNPPWDEEVVIQKPFPLPVPVSERRIFQIFPLPHGRHLVYWLAIAGPYRRGYLAVHGADGQALTGATVMPKWGPVAVDRQGEVFFVRPSSAGVPDVELVKARIAVR